jgi:uncharacterized protein (TIGR02145 family)
MKKEIFVLVLICIIMATCKKDSEKPAVTITDIDGNNYNTVTIGTKIWMAENLKTSKYNDGTSIPLVTGSSAWFNLTTPGYCWYDNDAATYKNTYGALYNWYTVYTGKLCPTGWHVPTDAEWTTLENYLGGSSVVGGKLKANTLWDSPNTGATNESGFTALPSGCRFGDGTFSNAGKIGFWWSATAEDFDNTAVSRIMQYNFSNVFSELNYKPYGFSVRCIKD